jgi:hypothetical protein
LDFPVASTLLAELKRLHTAAEVMSFVGIEDPNFLALIKLMCFAILNQNSHLTEDEHREQRRRTQPFQKHKDWAYYLDTKVGDASGYAPGNESVWGQQESGFLLIQGERQVQDQAINQSGLADLPWGCLSPLCFGSPQ